MSFKAALIVQGGAWKTDITSFELADGLVLERYESSRVKALYESVCKSQNVDDGDPHSFDLCIYFPTQLLDELFPYFGGPHSIISEICNLVVIATGIPIGFCRLFTSKDDFNTCGLTTPAYEWNPDMNFLRCDLDLISRNNGTITLPSEIRSDAALTDEKLNRIRQMYETLLAMRGSAITNTRIQNALDFFFYAWRSYYMPHVCMNLAIVLETLFSPAANTDISQRVAFHVCRFCGDDEEERVKLFKMIKKFYGLRSKIVHGDQPKESELYDLTPRVFHLVSWLLARLLSDWDLVSTFGNDKKREQLMNHWLFH